MSHSTMSAAESEIQAEIQAQEQQSSVGRVAGLPLVSSACEMASASSAATKETHPAVEAICDVAETGVRAITSAAVTGAQPVLDQLGPQIAAANEYTCRGLDRLEEQLPVLQQLIEKVALDAQDLVHATVVGVRDAGCSTVIGAKDAVTSLVDVATGAVWESLEIIKSAVSGSMSTVMGSSTGQEAASGIETGLGKSQPLADPLLPMTTEELDELATPVERSGEAPAEQQQSSHMRLASLSSTLCQRDYRHALGQMRQARQSTLEALAQLQQTIDLLECARQAMGQKAQDGQEKLQQMWLEWHKGQLGGSEDVCSPQPEEMVSQALATSHNLILQVQIPCHGLLSNIQGLPAALQEKVQQAYRKMGEIQASFSGAQSFQELSEGLLTQTREKVTKVQESLNELLEYVVQNVPLDWLVGSFAPAGDSAEGALAETKGVI